MSHTRSSLRIHSVLLLAVIIAGSFATLSAQTNVADNPTDLVFHKFHPKVSPGAQAAQTQAAPGTMSQSAMAQMESLAQEKRSRTATQRKIDSNVLATARMLQGQSVAAGVPYLETFVDLDVNDHIVVDITANVSDVLLEQMRGAGAQIVGSWPQYREIRAIVPPNQIETIAGFSEVIYVSRMREATTWGGLKPKLASKPLMSTRPGFEVRAANIRTYLNAMLPLLSEKSPRPRFGANTNGTGVGSQSSQGDVTHNASVARSTYGVTGAGLKIGVMSDGVTNLAVSQALGDLGPVHVLPGQAGSGDEGTAMLELVHDLAPSAQLYFASAFNGIASFAQNIRDLRAAGCDIIVDDVSYFVETRFQDGQAPSIVSTTNMGVVVQAVNDVVTDGAFYFSSAANSGNKDDGTSGTWEGDFQDGGAAVAPLAGAGKLHLFAPGVTYDVLARGGNPVFLEWSDPIGGSANDYDLYILDSTGTTIVAASTGAQSGTQDAVEAVGTSSLWTNYRIVVVLSSGVSRYLHLSTNRGTLSINTPGATFGHNAAKQAYTVAATPAFWQFGPGYPVGPYPNPFSATNSVELFSSDGPRHIFFQADGTPITAGDFSSTGGTVLNKPDITAADGTSVTGVGSFGSPFYGTSAAAPHAAAIAALIKSARPDIDAPGMRNALAGTAIDIMGSGMDRDSGTGIVMADAAIASLGAAPYANLELGTISATENPGNANGYIEPGEGVKLVVPLHNKLGASAATNITATLSTSTPGVFIPTPTVSTYANLAAGAGPVNGNVPFFFTLAPDFPPCTTSVDFTLSVQATGGPSPRVLSFSVPVGPPAVFVSKNLGNTGTGPAGFNMATGIQTGRISRSGVATSCATTPKAWPGYGATTGTRAYDSFSFTACRNTCAAIELTDPSNPSNASGLFTGMYSPSFDNSNIVTNYIGDSGASYSTQSFGVQLVAGNTYSVVIAEVTPGAIAGKPYTVALPGCAVSCNTPNNPPLAVAHDVTVTAPVSGTVAADIDNGSSDPDGDALTLTQSPAGPYPGGATAVILTVTDAKGAQSQASATVHVMLTPMVTIGASSNSVLPGANITFNATVAATGNGSTPTGSVQFKDGTTVLGSATLDANGEATYSTSSLLPGSHSITVVYAGDSHYVAATSSVLTQAVGQYDFSVTASPSSITIPRGKSGSVMITVTPIGTYVGTVTLSCGSLPANTTCTFSPATLSPTTSAVTSSVVISTLPGTVPAGTRSAGLVSTFSFGMLGLLFFPMCKTKVSKRTLAVIATLLLAIVLIGLAACGTSNSLNGNATAPGSYSVPLTVTGSANTHSANVNVVVTVLN